VKLGHVYSFTKRPGQAVAEFEKALELNPLQADALSWLVARDIADNQYERALERTEAHREQVADNPAMLAFLDYLQARLYLEKKEPMEAEVRLKSAIDRNPAMVGVYPLLAALYEVQGKVDEARAQYETLLEQNPKALSAYMALGALAEQEGRDDQAENYYRKALEIREDFVPAANNLAWHILKTGGNIDEALKFAQIAKENAPKSAGVMDTLGWVYYHKGRFPSAISELEDALELAPENPVIRFHVGMAYRSNRQFDQAQEHLEKALELDPAFDGADEARAVLEELSVQ
jgi:tetratricopeptide (TPR) repeat protein